MKAFAPNGSQILGTLERLSGRAEIAADTFDKKPDGTLEFAWEGSTAIFYDDQTTVTVGAVGDNANALKALKSILRAYDEGLVQFDFPVCPLVDAARAAVAEAAETGRIFLDADGIDWAEDELMLCEDGIAMVPASELKVGDMVDLEGDTHADPQLEHGEFASELQTVATIERETPDCVAVGFEGFDVVGFPPAHLLRVKERE